MKVNNRKLAILRSIEAAHAPRPAWNEVHHGMTWRDMPCRSETSTTEKKLNFALFRMGRLNAEETKYIEARRRSMRLPCN